MIDFTVHGPFEIQTEDKYVDKNEAKAFWLQDATAEWSERCGVYILGVRAGKGMTPLYVGKATKTFKQEVLGLHQRDLFNEALTKYGKGTPIVFLLVHPKRPGKVNANAIDELETLMIRAAAAANSGLMNVRKRTPNDTWKMTGFDVPVSLRAAGKGRRSQAMLDFARLMSVSSR